MDMHDTLISYLLVGAHALLYMIAAVVTLRPRVTVFHYFLVTQMISFAIRPLLAAQERFTLFPVTTDWDAYNMGLLFQLVAAFSFIYGYLLLYLPKGLTKVRLAQSVTTLPASEESRAPESQPFYSSDLRFPCRASQILFREMTTCLVIGAVFVVLIHVSSGGLWLPAARSEAVTAVVPFGKVVFPMAVIPLSVSFALALCFLHSWCDASFVWRGLFAVYLVMSGILLSLLYQRGFLLLGLVVFALVLDRTGQGTYGRLILLAGTALVLVFVIRPIAVLLISGQMPGIQVGLRANLLYKPNFVDADVWPVAIEYARGKGLLSGETFLAMPLRFVPPLQRRQLGLLTAMDILNESFFGYTYWESRFGFNVTLSQELFMNFGFLGLFMTLLAGLGTACLDRWIRRLDLRRPFSYFAFFAAFFTRGFMTDLGGALEWALVYLIVGLCVAWLSRLRLVSRDASSHLLEERS